MKRFELEPRISHPVRLGGERGENVVWAGRLAEKGHPERISFDGSDNFVVLEVGKRGSGKSYGMGSMLEAFASNEGSAIGSHTSRRGVLLLDPLDVHWPAIEPLRADGTVEMRRQHEVLTKWGDLQVEPVNVSVFLPAGTERDTDPPQFLPYRLPVSELDAADWAHLLNCDLVNEPRGQLIWELYRKVTETGWSSKGRTMPPRRQYGVEDLIECAEKDEDVQEFFHPETIRSVIQPLRSLARLPLFSSREGTPLTSIIEEGRLSILCLGRLSAAVRTVLTTVLIRKLRTDRMHASQIRRRLSLQALDESTRTELAQKLCTHVPRTILGIDEAQILMPAKGGSSAKQELDAYVLEGRNYGLSLWMATQRPKGAISSAAASQIDTFIVHRLSVKEDIDAVCGLLQNAQPNKIRMNSRAIDLPELIRSLDTGQALFSSSQSNVPRLVVGTIRPRVVAHGGDAF